jgi:hypothetical protein
VLGDARRFHERLPLVEADRDDHHAPPVARRKVAPERAVHVVPERRAVLVHGLRLPEEAQVGNHREGDVGERDLDELPLSGVAALAFRRKHCDDRVQAGGDVPRGERIVERERRSRSSGGERDP